MIRHGKWLLPGLLALLAGILTLSLLLSFPREKSEPDYAAEDTAASRYILREVDGCIAVFAAEDEREPEEITAIEVASLPVFDRERLRSGIGVSDASELIRLLEDLGS